VPVNVDDESTTVLIPLMYYHRRDMN